MGPGCLPAPAFAHVCLPLILFLSLPGRKQALQRFGVLAGRSVRPEGGFRAGFVDAHVNQYTLAEPFSAARGHQALDMDSLHHFPGLPGFVWR